jgi:hypothetical protein
MNAEQLKGQWTHFKGDLKQKWGKFTDDDLKQREIYRQSSRTVCREKGRAVDGCVACEADGDENRGEEAPLNGCNS